MGVLNRKKGGAGGSNAPHAEFFNAAEASPEPPLRDRVPPAVRRLRKVPRRVENLRCVNFPFSVLSVHVVRRNRARHPSPSVRIGASRRAAEWRCREVWRWGRRDNWLPREATPVDARVALLVFDA